MSLRKPSEQRERRYIVDYVRFRYPNSPALFNLRLGGIPAKLEGQDIHGLSSNIFKVFNRYVDAAVLAPDLLLLIEAKILADLGAVSQLQYYASLVSSTPELAAYQELPLKLLIVTASADPSFVAFATGNNVSVEIYTPPYATEYLSTLLK
jgi:hypothetical protein